MTGRIVGSSVLLLTLVYEFGVSREAMWCLMHRLAEMGLSRGGVVVVTAGGRCCSSSTNSRMFRSILVLWQEWSHRNQDPRTLEAGVSIKRECDDGADARESTVGNVGSLVHVC